MAEANDLAERIADVRCVALDVDGVLTDGRIYVSDSGERIRAFDVHDGSGIIYLQRVGIRVAILSSESREAVRHRARRLGIRTVLLGYKNKLVGLDQLLVSEQVEPEHVCYVGDDLPDVPVMRAVGLAVAVADAHPLVRDAAHWVTRCDGGRGAVREVAEHILKSQGLWPKILSRYFPDGAS